MTDSLKTHKQNAVFDTNDLYQEQYYSRLRAQGGKAEHIEEDLMFFTTTVQWLSTCRLT